MCSKKWFVGIKFKKVEGVTGKIKLADSINYFKRVVYDHDCYKFKDKHLLEVCLIGKFWCYIQNLVTMMQAVLVVT